jgi:hypothetical protein
VSLEAPARRPGPSVSAKATGHALRKEAPGDRIPVKLPRYDRVIRADWSNPREDAWNLAREIEDIHSRPELITPHERGFLRALKSNSIRGNEVWMAPIEQRRLAAITRRFVDVGYAAGWRKAQVERLALVSAEHVTA